MLVAEGKAVIDVHALLAPGDHTGITQDSQMLGDGGHVVPHQGLQVTDAFFAVAQGIDHQQTAGMAQGFEDPGLCLDEFLVVLHVVPLFGHLAKYS